MPRALILGALVTIAIYAQTVRDPFVYEDASAVAANPAVMQGTPIGWTRVRVLTRLSYRLDHALAGPRPWIYHADNVLLHIVNGVLVAAIAANVGASPVVAALVFWWMPFASESVAYVAARNELLAAACLLLGVWIWLRARGRLLPIGLGLACFLLALAAKETHIGLVALFVVALMVSWTIRAQWRTGTLLTIGGVALTLALVVFTTLRHEYVTGAEPRLLYLARLSAVLLHEATLIVAPVGRLTVDHGSGFPVWAMAGSLALVVGALVGLVLTARLVYLQLWGSEIVVLAGLWIAADFAPRFVLRLPEMPAEHHWYVPLVAVAILVAAWWDLQGSDANGHE